MHLVWPGAHIADFRRADSADSAAVFPPLASGLNGGSGLSCALGSIEHIEVVATIAAFVEHCDLGFQDRRAERFSTVST